MTYDAVGNRTSEVQEQNGQTFQRNVLGYDAEHRLVSVDAADLGTGAQFIRMELKRLRQPQPLQFLVQQCRRGS
ncbi:hypothetical protein [Pseudoduganella sp. R-43]|uniref:hypothetical protein n=1 Tax=unclassified Pseudoduganella TaxID=2637179 RepID=UPI003CF29AC7